MTTTHTFTHRQTYAFKLHRAKLDLLASALENRQDYVRLLAYFHSIPRESFPHALFVDADDDRPGHKLRSSQVDLNLLPIKRVHKENLANDLALLGLILAKRNTERHAQIQDFMLINDSSTIACEVPIYLTAQHIRYFHTRGFALPLTEEDAPITGHIDFVQVRNGYIHILDYKPDTRKFNPVSQLTIYALALASHTKLPMKLFKCAWFDEKDYFEFYPLHDVYPKILGQSRTLKKCAKIGSKWLESTQK